MSGGRNGKSKVCDREVLKLCNKAAEGVYYHRKCDESKNAVLLSGGDINTYLRHFETGYGVYSKNGITTVANAMDEDKSYYVCANYKARITKVVAASTRSSVRLNPQTRTPIDYTDNIDL